MTAPALEWAYLAAAAQQAAAPATAAWARLDTGIGLPSIVVMCIFFGSCAAVLRDRQAHSGALFGTFFTALIATVAFVHFVVAKILGDPASQAVAGLFLAYNSQLWAGKFTKKVMKQVDAPEGRQADD